MSEHTKSLYFIIYIIQISYFLFLGVEGQGGTGQEGVRGSNGQVASSLHTALIESYSGSTKVYEIESVNPSANMRTAAKKRVVSLLDVYSSGFEDLLSQGFDKIKNEDSCSFFQLEFIIKMHVATSIRATNDHHFEHTRSDESINL